MREQDRINELWFHLLRTKEPAVLATVVRVAGSSYRLPGARLLIARNGQRAGGISGGCLEDEVVRKAWWLAAGGPVVRTYDTTVDGETPAGAYGLGCSGVIHLLLERVTADEASVLPILKAVDDQRQPAVIAHLLTPAPLLGRRLILMDRQVILNTLRHATLEDCLLPQMRSLTASSLIAEGAGPEVFLEYVVPPPRLLVFGAGDDAVPLTQLASNLGWRTGVFDSRSHYARAEKFPAAQQVAVRAAGDPAPPVDRWTAALVMSHSYSQDLDVLRSLAAAPPLRYLGVLGPRKRTQRLLVESGIVDSASYAGLHSPMGLDLGGDGPEQVALSVIAEIQAVLHDRSGGFLRNRGAPIHDGETPADTHGWVRSDVCA